MEMGMLPVLDSQPEYLRSLFGSGKDLVSYDEALMVIALQAGVTPLMDSFSISRAEADDEGTGRF